jgi:pimeloyl-ACP methyl ester carboxylesterase
VSNAKTARPKAGGKPPVDEDPPVHREEMTLHGRSMSYRIAGEGPAIVLIHGITGSSEQWRHVMPLLADRFTVIAPDLMGHGKSDKPRGDYSLGSHATGVRDLMVALGHPTATVLGHSLGGGIAMQMSYQFPERTERLVLVSSGGLGREVNPLLRAATLPGSELVLPLLSNRHVRSVGLAGAGLLGRLGFRAGSDLAEMATGHNSLADPETRHAFLDTLRSVVDYRGQRVTATDKLYLAADMPSLIIWGRRDPMIPVEHAGEGHRAMPGSRLEVFDDAGHFPQLDEPLRFARVLGGFVESTEPSEIHPETLRERLLGLS